MIHLQNNKEKGVFMAKRARCGKFGPFLRLKNGLCAKCDKDSFPVTDTICYNVVDLETPNQRNDRMSAISVTKVFGNKILTTDFYLVNPEAPFSSVNSSITGITAEIVREAPTFPQIWETLRASLQDGVFVAHNAPFDLSVLFKCLRDYNLVSRPIRYIDTVELVRDAFPELGRYSLDAVCAALSIQLDHHHADSDSLACACILVKCMDNGIDIDRYVHIFDIDRVSCSGHTCMDSITVQTKHTKNLSKSTKQINNLLSLVGHVCKDGKVTEDEISELREWINTHDELAKEFPYALIHASIEEALKDGVLETQELQQLFKTFLFLLDPVGCTAPCDGIDLSDKMVCLTGDFDYGTKEDVESFLNGLGAVVHPRVIAKVDYLIVGNLASSEWSAGRYGNKIKQALQLQLKGRPIKIIKESDLMNVLRACSENL